MKKMNAQIAIALSLAVGLVACGDEKAPTSLDTNVPLPSGDVSEVVDGSTTGNADFAWLPPIVKNGSPAGSVTPGLTLVIDICAQDGSARGERCGPDALVASKKGDKYQANWKTDKKDAGESFDVLVKAESSSGPILGSLVVTLQNKGSEKAGRNIPLKFWIGGETGDCLGNDRCNIGTLIGNEGGLVEVEDEGGNMIAFAMFDDGWDPAGGGAPARVVRIDCRDDSFTPPAGPLNTALDQLPLYCSYTLDPPLAPGEEFTEPQMVGICEIQTVDHSDPVLGKQGSDGVFELLPKTGTAGFLSETGCENVSFPEVASGFWSGASKLASVLRFLGPQPLAAFRDGGVGGLVRSFSDINPVLPATIEGTVTDASGNGLEGVTVTLENGGVQVATTDAAGEYSFFPLLDDEYTVTVSDLPSGFTVETPSQTVVVPGTGHFHADFVADPQYTVEQAEASYGVSPLVGTTDVESFYDYGGLPAPATASSNTGLEQSNTSILFVYEDDEGRASLVMIHDAPNDGSGGKAEFSFGGSLIGEESEIDFIVRDDSGFACGEEGPAEADVPDSCWRWNDQNTDGGALGYLPDEFSLTIDPSFPSGGGLSAGAIDTWILLSFPDGTSASATQTVLSKGDVLTISR